MNAVQLKEATLDQKIASGDIKIVGESVLLETGASCCYARSTKAWLEDPAGLRWETFYTFGDITTYGHSAEETHIESMAATTYR